MRGTANPITAATRGLLAARAVARASMASRAAEAGAGEAAAPRGGKSKIIIVTGPTAVGKTKIGLALARRLGGEVISADSVQVYTGLDVGSDKVRAPLAGRAGAVGPRAPRH
jgi:adenylylsulfate kinase-like enzyme